MTWQFLYKYMPLRGVANRKKKTTSATVLELEFHDLAVK